MQPDSYHLLTAPGPAAIAIMRLRGPGVREFLRRRLQTEPAGRAGSLRRAVLLDDGGQAIDDLLLETVADDDVRLHLHGNPLIAAELAALLHSAGFAETAAQDVWPGLSLLDAEFAALLPRMRTLRGVRWLAAQHARLADWARQPPAPAERRAAARRLHRVAWFTDPLRVALVGAPNAGKSRLMNALTDRPTSIVSAVAGSTRDWVEAEGECAGFPVVWIDTAGIRDAGDALEHLSVERTRAVAHAADAVVAVIDGAAPRAEALHQLAAACAGRPPAVVVWSKADLWRPGTPSGPPLPAGGWPTGWPAPVPCSALEPAGPAAVGRALVEALGRAADPDAPAAFTERQAAELEQAAETIY